jgi:hypothetical protein
MKRKWQNEASNCVQCPTSILRGPPLVVTVSAASGSQWVGTRKQTQMSPDGEGQAGGARAKVADACQMLIRHYRGGWLELGQLLPIVLKIGFQGVERVAWPSKHRCTLVRTAFRTYNANHFTMRHVLFIYTDLGALRKGLAESNAKHNAVFRSQDFRSPPTNNSAVQGVPPR